MHTWYGSVRLQAYFVAKSGHLSLILRHKRMLAHSSVSMEYSLFTHFLRLENILSQESNLLYSLLGSACPQQILFTEGEMDIYIFSTIIFQSLKLISN